MSNIIVKTQKISKISFKAKNKITTKFKSFVQSNYSSQFSH